MLNKDQIFVAIEADLFWGRCHHHESSNVMHHTHCNIFRFELELKPTGEVEQYSARAFYELQRDGEALVDMLKFVTQAKGKCPEKGPSISALGLRSRTHKQNIFNLMYLTNIY